MISTELSSSQRALDDAQRTEPPTGVLHPYLSPEEMIARSRTIVAELEEWERDMPALRARIALTREALRRTDLLGSLLATR